MIPCGVPEPDPYLSWSLSDRLQLLAFEAQLAHLPRSLVSAIWEAIDGMGPPGRVMLEPHSLRPKRCRFRPLPHSLLLFNVLSRFAASAKRVEKTTGL